MPPVEEAVEVDKQAPGAKPVIGIIYPPPEVRNIVDKTASFVARNGPEFESRIRQNELKNPKFNFLNTSDPYYAYYQHKVKEFKEGRGQEPSASTKLGFGLAPQKPAQEQQAKLIEHSFPKEAPPEFEFIADPPSISAFDLDVVKLTAQFVARNGRQFLTNLMNREQRNYQFDFLRPQHSLFNYFTKLVEQYTKILIPPKDLLPRLRKQADDSAVTLDEVKYRVDWAKFQERQRQKEEEAKEKERVAYAQVDWHDFVVVETVDFQQNEMGNLPPPTTPEEVGARMLAQERFEHEPEPEAVEMEVESDDEEGGEAERGPPAVRHLHPGDDTQVQDMEESGSEDEDDEPPTREQRFPPSDRDLRGGPGGEPKPPPPPPPPKDPQPPPLPPMPEHVMIKQYDPKSKHFEAKIGSDNMVVSPFTGEKIPADKIQEHIRINLLDPNYIEKVAPKEQQSLAARGEEEVFAAGSAIGSSLKQLAERRTDIFGIGSEETQIGKKIGEEEKKERARVIWDGHTASMEKVTQKARENISIEEQIAVIHKVKGLLPDVEKEKIGPAMPKGGGPPVLTGARGPMGTGARGPVGTGARGPVGTGGPSSMPQPPGTTAPVSKPPPVTMAGKPPQPAPVSIPAPPAPPMMPAIAVPVPPRPMMVMSQPPMPPAPVVGIPGPPMPPVMAPMPPMGMPRPPGTYAPPPMPPGASMPAVPVTQTPAAQAAKRQAAEDEAATAAKKLKTEENLIPEQQFLANNQAKGPVQFRVSVPNMKEKPEWNLNGQTLTYTLPLTDNVSVIKAKLHETLGMAAGKQKLQLEGMFIKDSNTLAFYNFVPNCTVQLQVKERGGRKK